MPIDAVVADANVLLSALIGGAAIRVFNEFFVVVHVAEFNVREVEEYLPRMAKRYGLALPLVFLHWNLLPVKKHAISEYSRALGKATECLKNRDPEDAHSLALAHVLGCPLWSNDRDLENCGVPSHSTARLLKILESDRPR